jgi:hypothetical protein
MKTIQNLGFSCRIETINAVEAWRDRSQAMATRTSDGLCCTP